MARRRRGRASAALVAALLVCAAGLSASHAAGTARTDRADARGPLDLATARLDQERGELVLELGTRGRWTGAELARDRRRSLCLYLAYGARRTPRGRVCVVRAGHAALRYATLDPTGRRLTSHPLRAVVSHSGQRLRARFAIDAAHLPVGAFRWTVRSTWVGRECPPGKADCQDALPDRGQVTGRIRAFRVVGCRAHAPWFHRGAKRRDRAVALTFDDGPSAYTPRFLSALERAHAHATFFLVGSEVGGRGADLRRALRDGDALGNHTYRHPDVSGGGSFARRQLASTSSAVARATHGYRPCVFRPPYGRSSGRLVDVARSLGMGTVEWDVDPNDYTRPGSYAIFRRVTSAVRPGSIVIMHDGGGDRSQTLAALPSIVHNLRARGYHLLTVPQMLGYAPVLR